LLEQAGKRCYSIQAVENALTVLEALGNCDSAIRLSRLSEAVGMHKSYIFRVLATFEKKGYVEKAAATGEYRLGLNAYEIGQKLLSRMGLRTKAKLDMERLGREFNEAVYLAVAREHEVLMLDVVDTTQLVGIVPLVGNRYPLTQTAAGKVFLAFDGPRHSGRTEALPPSLMKELQAIRDQGVAVDVGGIGPGATCLAVPLFNVLGKVGGCLCMVGPAFRFPEERIQTELLPALTAAGKTVSSKLGFHDFSVC